VPGEPRIALVICTYRRPAAVLTLLRALADQTRGPDEVLVVDGSPGPETARVLEGAGLLEADGFAYAQVGEEDRGLTRQRNWGVAHTRSEIVAFLDDDTVPEPTYFEEVRACFGRHPDAVGVGGYMTNEVAWRAPGVVRGPASISVFRLDGWERREDVRWRLRRLLGLASPQPPGRIPRSGHGRPVTYFPPSGEDREVDFIVGAAFAWKRDLLEKESFSRFFEGYGLYEDFEYSVRASRHGALVLCTAARLGHHHAEGGRPDAVRYGRMVVRNGWYVWRSKWPRPSLGDRARWWATTFLLAGCVVADAVRGREPGQALAQALGRIQGAVGVLLDPPCGPAEERDG